MNYSLTGKARIAAKAVMVSKRNALKNIGNFSARAETKKETSFCYKKTFCGDEFVATKCTFNRSKTTKVM